MATDTKRETRRGGPAVVELVGAPGSGKTTLIPAVMQACRDEGLHPYTVVAAARPFAARTLAGRVVTATLPTGLRRKVLWALFLAFRALAAIGFAARHPGLARYVAASARARPAAADAGRRKVVHWYVRLAGAFAFLTSRGLPDEVLVLDEGFVHRVVQLHASSVEVPEAGRIDAYAELIPRPDLLVHVRAPVEACERRVRSRGAWDRFRGRDPGELSRFLANAHRATVLVAEAARANGWSVVEVDNDGADPAAASAALGPLVSAALARRGRGPGR